MVNLYNRVTLYKRMMRNGFSNAQVTEMMLIHAKADGLAPIDYVRRLQQADTSQALVKLEAEHLEQSMNMETLGLEAFRGWGVRKIRDFRVFRVTK